MRKKINILYPNDLKVTNNLYPKYPEGHKGHKKGINNLYPKYPEGHKGHKKGTSTLYPNDLKGTRGHKKGINTLRGIKGIKGINKKGDKLLSVYWFAILVIVAVGIVLMVNSFYGKNYDVRAQESKILSQKVADCIYFGGEFNPLLINSQGGFRDDFKDNFLEKCLLNLTINEEFERPPYYVEAEFFSEGNLKKTSFFISEGNKNWKSDCNVTVSGRDKLATCSQNDFFAKTNSNSLYLIKILSIVGKVEENTN